MTPAHRVGALIRRVVPAAARRWVRGQLHGVNGQRGLEWQHFCSLRRVQPIRRDFGWQFGQSIDRYYIEEFLARHATDVRGRVLEVADNVYTRRFGDDRVVHSDVLHVTPGTPGATIIGDLSRGDQIPSGTFDCIILTHTLQYIYDTRAAVRTLHRSLAPGGVLLLASPGISQVSRYDMDHWGEYWRFTTLAARTLFAEVFPPENVTVGAYGNVLTAVAYLHGLVTRELHRAELDYRDQDYEVIVTVRAVKSAEEGTPSKQ
jgi:SAM-dependent methyltransferase